jgi:dihydroorotate dehydrogenase (NAD+) catalytic subunit
MTEAPDLSVEFCGLRLANPLVLGSGGLGETAAGLQPFLEAGAAAVVTRTLRLRVGPDRAVFPSPHLAVGPSRQYLLNCEWGNLTPWEYWTRRGLPELREQGTVIVSVSGRHRDDCVALARQLDRAGVCLFEVNVSCSHSGHLYGRPTDDIGHLQSLVTGLKRAVRAPVMVKLGWSPALPDVARAVARAGADAISVTNSIGPGLDVRLEDGRPELGITGGAGGMTGRAIFPIALECVHQVVEAVDLPVMGVGGIASFREVAKMLFVGAACVQIYSEAFLRGPDLFPRILRDLSGYLDARGYAALAEIRGLSRPFLSDPSNTVPIVPIVVEDRCPACGACAPICPPQAITMGQTAEIRPDLCIGCGACIHVCPTVYGALLRPESDRPSSPPGRAGRERPWDATEPGHTVGGGRESTGR